MLDPDAVHQVGVALSWYLPNLISPGVSLSRFRVNPVGHRRRVDFVAYYHAATVALLSVNGNYSRRTDCSWVYSVLTAGVVHPARASLVLHVTIRLPTALSAVLGVTTRRRTSDAAARRDRRAFRSHSARPQTRRRTDTPAERASRRFTTHTPSRDARRSSRHRRWPAAEVRLPRVTTRSTDETAAWLPCGHWWRAAHCRSSPLPSYDAATLRGCTTHAHTHARTYNVLPPPTRAVLIGHLTQSIWLVVLGARCSYCFNRL